MRRFEFVILFTFLFCTEYYKRRKLIYSVFFYIHTCTLKSRFSDVKFFGGDSFEKF